MNTRTLGQGLEVSALGLGCMIANRESGLAEAARVGRRPSSQCLSPKSRRADRVRLRRAADRSRIAVR
jgi:aryl-alcohol dehydrogenase-like predicted oxidoreductase